MIPEEISLEPGKVAFRRDFYGGERFEFVKVLARGGQGYALLVDDKWCGGQAVLKGLWWDPALFRDESWRAGLDRSKARQQQGLKAVYRAMQLTQQAPPVIDVLVEESPTLEARGITPQDEEYFVVTEFVGIPGKPVRTLEDEIRERGEGDKKRRFTEDELIDLAEQLCGALAALHTPRRGGRGDEYWIHADLKPENVLVLGPPAQYVLIDYDAAVVRGEPISTTTPAYSPPAPPGTDRSPELDSASEKFDIYMLGASLAHALTLARLDENAKRKLYGTIQEHNAEKQRLAKHGLSPILTTLIASCLADPDYRTRNVQSILADLARARDGAVLSSVLLGGK
jgi:serine/threonine protein kinase